MRTGPSASTSSPRTTIRPRSHACLARIESLGTLAAAHDDDAPHLLHTQALQASEWQHEVRRAVDAIHGGAFGKVVLARDVLEQYARPLPSRRCCAGCASATRMRTCSRSAATGLLRRRHAGTARACRGRRRAHMRWPGPSGAAPRPTTIARSARP